jgi:phospholipid/cholesterol/gamma-HCH transport system permease protein
MEISRAEGRDRLALRFVGAFPSDAVPAMRKLVRELADRPRMPVDIDLSAVDAMDGSTMAVLLELRSELASAGAETRIIGAHDGVERLLALYESAARRPPQAPPPAAESMLEQIGRAVEGLVEDVHTYLDYLGNLLDAARATITRPGNVNWNDIPRLMERAGADGFPIVVMITFLVGMVTAFQAIVQLRQFGADIFVADLVALSVTRELGPLMTAIIVAGRSGAAFSAELGTMTVSEEVDALRTLGLSPYGFLVYPRLIAMVAVVPLLTLVGDLCGILGGVFVSMLRLDITLPAYLARTQQVLDMWDVGSGVMKSVVFGWAIALVACQRGLATRGGAAGVGLSTTSAVVASLFALVVIDALFTVIFNLYGV